MTDRVAQLEAALRADRRGQRLLTAYIQGSQRGAAINGLLELLDGLDRRAMRVAPSSARARKTPRGLASGVVARRSKRVLSRLFRLKKKLPCQIFGLMGS